jgi:hypothetical protein
MIRALTLLILALRLALPASASEETPQRVVEQYHRDYLANGWVALTKYLHPEELARSQHGFLTGIPDNAASRRSLAELYGQDVTLARLRESSPEQFIRPILVAMQASLDRARLRVTELQVLGTVEEGDLRHVVYRWRSETPQLKMSQIEVRTLRQHQGSWRLLLPMDLQASLAGVQQGAGR